MNTSNLHKERETVKRWLAEDGTEHETDEAASEHEMKGSLLNAINEWDAANEDASAHLNDAEAQDLAHHILKRFDVSEKPHWNAETIGVAVDKDV